MVCSIPSEWEGVQGGQKWGGTIEGMAVQVYLSPQKQQVVLQYGGYRKIIFNSPLLLGFAKAWEVANVSVLTLGDAAKLLSSAWQHHLNEDESCP